MQKEPTERSASRKGLEFFGLLTTHLIVALLMVSAALSFTAFLARLMPGWQLGYVPWITLFVSLEAMYSWRYLNTSRWMGSSVGLYRAGELIFLLVAARLGLYLQSGPAQLIADLLAWRENFPFGFFPGEFLVVVVFLGMVWLFSTEFTADLAAMETEKFIVDFETLGLEMVNRSYARRLMINRIFMIGIGMVVLTALVRSDLGILWRGRGSIDYEGLNVLAYFLLALTLVSLSQFAILRARWAYDRIPLGPRLTSGWVGYSLLFFAIITGVALVLPTGYSIGILQLVSLAIGYLYYFLFSIIALLVLIFARILSLVTFEPDALPPASPEFIPTPVPPALVSPTSGPAWVEIVRSLFFWLLIIGITSIALNQYLRQYGGLLANLKKVRGLGWLIRGLQALASSLQVVRQGLERSVRVAAYRLRARRSRSSSAPARTLVNPWRYSPRDRIIYFYLAMIRKGGQHGHPRTKSHTPYEYASHLKPHLGSAADDMDKLTETFLEARYSQHGMGEKQAGLARRAWRSVLKALKGLGRSATR